MIPIPNTNTNTDTKSYSFVLIKMHKSVQLQEYENLISLMIINQSHHLEKK